MGKTLTKGSMHTLKLTKPKESTQNLDGTPHFAYFDADTQLSFVWDGGGLSSLEICHGGYGEPVIATMEVDGWGLEGFAAAVKEYLAEGHKKFGDDWDAEVDVPA